VTTVTKKRPRKMGRRERPASKAFEEIVIASFREAAAIKRGELAPARRYTLPRTARDVEITEPKPFASADVIRVRQSLGLSQTVFARALGKSPPTIRSWEQGERTPDPAANRMLEIVERHPRVLLEFVKRPSTK
jgi:DNA-binding transcriptional regulator YiaG